MKPKTRTTKMIRKAITTTFVNQLDPQQRPIYPNTLYPADKLILLQRLHIIYISHARQTQNERTMLAPHLNIVITLCESCYKDIKDGPLAMHFNSGQHSALIKQLKRQRKRQIKSAVKIAPKHLKPAKAQTNWCCLFSCFNKKKIVPSIYITPDERAQQYTADPSPANAATAEQAGAERVFAIPGQESDHHIFSRGPTPRSEPFDPQSFSSVSPGSGLPLSESKRHSF